MTNTPSARQAVRPWRRMRLAAPSGTGGLRREVLALALPAVAERILSLTVNIINV